jgi:hypothetical protein
MINHHGQITKLKKKKKNQKNEKEDKNQNKTHMDLIFHFPKNQRILIFQVVIGYN